MQTIQEAALQFTATLSEPRRRGLLSLCSQRVYRHYAEAAASHFGNTALATFNDGDVSSYVKTLRSKQLSPSSITAHVSTLAAILKSAKNEKGVRVCSFVIDKEDARVPIVKPTPQECASREDVEGAIALGVVLVPFLAASGLRVSEALALEVNGEGDSYKPETGAITVCKTLKTAAAARTVLLPDAFRVWFNSRIPASGRIFSQSYQQVHTMLENLGLPNAHSARRFRATHLRKMRMQEDVLRSQLGHSRASITDRYSFAADDASFVAREVASAGLGFELTRKAKFVGVSDMIEALVAT
jgi:integrase